jgi:hypothetical protein
MELPGGNRNNVLQAQGSLPGLRRSRKPHRRAAELERAAGYAAQVALRLIPRWEVRLFRKKGERLGVIDARDEKEATTKAAKEFNFPPERHWQIVVTKLADKK